MPRILVVDDDQSFLDTYADLLQQQGYTMEAATSAAEARQKLDDPDGWDIVLLDQKLQGAGGPDGGLELIAETQLRAPGAKVILVTAFAHPDAIRRAFESGAYDYLEKTELLPELLRTKIANAWEAVRGYRLAKHDQALIENKIAETWDAVRTEADNNKKGALLEELLDLVMSSIEGFRTLGRNRKNEIEEIDVTIANESDDPTWSRESPYILVECKNWSSKVGRPELDVFLAKIRRKFGRCKLGLFVAVNGFTKPFEKVARTQDDVLVVLIGPKNLARLVESSDRSKTLKTLVDDAVLSTNGK